MLEKAPIISETELDYRWRKGLAKEQNHLDAAREVAQAQRDFSHQYYLKQVAGYVKMAKKT